MKLLRDYNVCSISVPCFCMLVPCDWTRCSGGARLLLLMLLQGMGPIFLLLCICGNFVLCATLKWHIEIVLNFTFWGLSFLVSFKSIGLCVWCQGLSIFSRRVTQTHCSGDGPWGLHEMLRMSHTLPLSLPYVSLGNCLAPVSQWLCPHLGRSTCMWQIPIQQRWKGTPLPIPRTFLSAAFFLAACHADLAMLVLLSSSISFLNSGRRLARPGFPSMSHIRETTSGQEAGITVGLISCVSLFSDQLPAVQCLKKLFHLLGFLSFNIGRAISIAVNPSWVESEVQ